MNRKDFFKNAIGATVATVVGSKLDFVPEVPEPDYLRQNVREVRTGRWRGNQPSQEVPKDIPGKDPQYFTIQCDGYTVRFRHNPIFDGPIENYAQEIKTFQ